KKICWHLLFGSNRRPKPLKPENFILMLKLGKPFRLPFSLSLRFFLNRRQLHSACLQFVIIRDLITLPRNTGLNSPVQFLLGTRRGELCALRVSFFRDTVVSVRYLVSH